MKKCPRCGFEFPENPVKTGARVLKEIIKHPGKALKANKRGSKCEKCPHKLKSEKSCVMEKIV